MRRRWRRSWNPRPTLALAALLAAGGCGAPAPPAGTAEVVAEPVARLPEDPADPAWQAAPVHRAALMLQDMVEPRLLEPSTAAMDVQAVTDGRRVAFRLSWADGSGDDLPGSARFVDACAVQLPTVTAADVPAPQMGEPGRPVEITYWRASWQAVVDGREDSIRSLYPGAKVDHYPFEAASLEDGSPEQQELAAQYAPARALGHPPEGPRDSAVQDLVAQGPGTLAPAGEPISSGRGARTGDGWAVVLVRPLPADLPPGGRTQVAVAVWQGSQGEVGARKMRSGWIPLHVSPGTTP